MKDLLLGRAEGFRQTHREHPVGIVAAAHHGFFVDQVLDDVPTDLLVERAQPGIHEDPAEGADVLARDEEEVQRPLLELLSRQLTL